MPRLSLILCLLLAGCDSPAPAMFGAHVVHVTREGRAYSVYRRGDWVEVIRFGWADRRDRAAIRQQMVALIPEVTGCIATQRSLRGDSGEIRARLRCPAGRGKLNAEMGM
ncbi:MAG: hypothetical protein KGK00_08285 [Paracoccaceae bacterium]|nr:hypothetical protein [Paracoccaceae bacterium]MDE3240274.1 hypothetical protein [Paracoccaceae bacterium]